MKPAVRKPVAESTADLDVSVILCAYLDARWNDLVRAVASIQRQTRPVREIIVVVDHNSRLLQRVREAMPGVVAVENRNARGLSGARNTGITVARSQVVAFLDDDAEAAPDWLEQLTRWYAHAEVVGVGGRVEPAWEGGQPAWLPNEFLWVVGCSYEGLPAASSAVRNLFGGCMCLRRTVFELAGGFNDGIGRGEGRPMGCEETELCIRASQRRPEWRFIYEPRASANHRVPAQRTRWRYFLSRCYAEGLSKAQVTRLVGGQAALSAERSYSQRTLPRGVLRGLADAVLRGDATGLLRTGAIIAGLGCTLAGYAVGILRHD
jgi:glycosyltransferase involved in cell wall biosynthesis